MGSCIQNVRPTVCVSFRNIMRQCGTTESSRGFTERDWKLPWFDRRTRGGGEPPECSLHCSQQIPGVRGETVPVPDVGLQSGSQRVQRDVQELVQLHLRV